MCIWEDSWWLFKSSPVKNFWRPSLNVSKNNLWQKKILKEQEKKKNVISRDCWCKLFNRPLGCKTSDTNTKPRCRHEKFPSQNFFCITVECWNAHILCILIKILKYSTNNDQQSQQDANKLTAYCEKNAKWQLLTALFKVTRQRPKVQRSMQPSALVQVVMVTTCSNLRLSSDALTH